MAKLVDVVVNLIDKHAKKQLNDIENKKYRVNLEVDRKGVNEADKSVKQLGSSVASTNTTFGKLKNTISNTFSPNRVSMTGFLAVLNEINKAGKKAKETIKEVDKAITDLSIATNMSREATAGLVKEYNSYAKELKSTTTQITSAADDYLRAGKSMSETKKLIEDSVMLSKLGQLETPEATEDLLATMNGFEMSVEEVGNALDAMVAIDMKAATSAGDIATALKYSASSADMAGLSFNKLASMIGTVQDKTQQSAETVGTFMNTLLSRYRNVKIGQFVSDDGEDLSEVETILESLDIKLRDSNLKFRNFELVIDEVASKWQSYSSVQQAAIAKAFSGTRQQNRFIALMEGYGKVLELTEVAANSAGTALEKFNNSYKNSLEAKQNDLQASFESMVINSDMDEVYSSILEATKALIDFINHTNALKGVMTGLSVSAGIKGFLTLRTAINESYIAMNQFSNALKIVKQTNISTADFDKLLLLTKNLSDNQMKMVLSSNTLGIKQKELLLVNTGLSTEEAQLKLQTLGLTTAQTGLTVATTNLGNAFKGLIASMVANPLVVFTMAVSGAVMAYQSYNQKLEETRQKNIEASETAIDHANSLRKLYDEYSRLSAIQDKTSSEEESFKTVIEDVTKALGDKAKVLEGLTAGTNEYTEALAKATKEELQSASVDATIGRKSAEEELQADIWSEWSGSKVSIDSNSKGKSISDEAQRAVDIVSDTLKDFETINRTWDNLSWDISSDSPEEAMEYYNALLKAREELVLASENDEVLLDTEIYKDMNNAISIMEESLDSYITKRYEEEKLNYMALHGIPQTIDEYKVMQDSLAKTTNESQALQDKFNTLLMSDFSGLANELESVADVQAEVGVATPDMTKFTSSISTSVQQIATQLEPQFAKLGEAYKEIFTVDGFTLNNVDNTMLEELRQSFAEIEEEVDVAFDATQLNAFFDSLTNGNSTAEQVQQSFNELATAYFYSTDTLEHLNSVTADSIIKQLEEMGVQNAQEVVLEALTGKTEELIVQKEYLAQTGQMLSEVTDAEATAFILEQIEAGNCGQALALLQLKKMLVNGTLLDTSADINNILALAQAAGVATEALGRLQSLQMQFDNAKASGNYGAMSAITQEMAKTKEQIKTDIANFEPVEIEVDFGVIDGGSEKASKAGKDAGDVYKDAFTAEVEELENLRDQGLITEKQFLDKFRSLYEKYFKDVDGYAKDFADNQRKYLEGYYGLYNSALSGISRLMDSKIDGYRESKEIAIESLEAEKEAAEEAYQAQIDAIDDKIKALEKQKKVNQDIIDGLNDEIEAIREANNERDRQITLQQKQIQMQQALNQRTTLQYSDSKGMHYVQDLDGIRKAKTELDNAEDEIRIAEIEKQIKVYEDANDKIDDTIDNLNEQKDAIKEMLDASNEYYDNLIKQQEKYYDSLIKNAEKQKSQWEQLGQIKEVAEAYSAIEQVFGELGYTVEDVLNGSTGAFEDFKAKYIGLINDMNSNSSFAEGLSYATGIAEEDLGSFLGKTEEVAQGLDDLSSKGEGLNTVADAMNKIGTSATTLATNTEGLDENLSGITDSLTTIPDGTEALSGWVTGFADLGNAIKGVAEALGLTEENSIGGLVDALQSISEVSLGGTEDGEGTGIIGQFTALKEAVDSVTSSISGGASGESPSGGDASNSKSPSMSSGATEGGEGGLIGSIEEMGKKATETLGEGSTEEGADGEGAGVIGKFAQLKSAVDLVTQAIGTGEEGDEEEGAINLIGALQAHYEKAEETLPEVKTLFEDLLVSIEACVTALNTMVSTMTSMGELSVGGGVSLPAHAEGTVGKAFAKGTGKYKGLAHDEKLAVRSEYGQPETTIYPDGTVELTTEPTASSLPKDTVILNEEQTKKMLGNKGTVLGNAYANGTIDVPVNLPSYLRPLQEGDKMYDLIQKMNNYQESFGGQIIHPVNAIQKNMDTIVRNISNVNNNSMQNVTNLNMGDIVVQGVQDVDGLAHAIKTRFPNAMIQAMSTTR